MIIPFTSIVKKNFDFVVTSDKITLEGNNCEIRELRQIIHITVHAFDHEFELLCCFSITFRRQICLYTLHFPQGISLYVISCTVFTPCQEACAL